MRDHAHAQILPVDKIQNYRDVDSSNQVINCRANQVIRNCDSELETGFVKQ